MANVPTSRPNQAFQPTSLPPGLRPAVKAAAELGCWAAVKVFAIVASTTLWLAGCSSSVDRNVEQLVSAKNRWQEFCPEETYTLTYTRTDRHWRSPSEEVVHVINAKVVEPDAKPKEDPKIHGMSVRDMFDLVLRASDPNSHMRVSVQYDPEKGAPSEFSLEFDGEVQFGYDFKVKGITGCKGTVAAVQLPIARTSLSPDLLFYMSAFTDTQVLRGSAG